MQLRTEMFEDVKLSPEVLKGLYNEIRFNRPSKILAITLPMIITAGNSTLFYAHTLSVVILGCYWMDLNKILC